MQSKALERDKDRHKSCVCNYTFFPLILMLHGMVLQEEIPEPFNPHTLIRRDATWLSQAIHIQAWIETRHSSTKRLHSTHARSRISSLLYKHDKTIPVEEDNIYKEMINPL
jgi:hypothetical protein